MKKLSLFILVLLIAASHNNLYAQNEPDECLLIHYPFNGNTNDHSYFGNNATTYGATLTDDMFGDTNKAYEISGNTGTSGSDIYIGVPNVVDSLENLSISIWVKHNSLSTSNYGETYISFGTLPQMGLASTAIYYSKDHNKIYFFVMTENGRFGCSTSFSSSWVGTFQHFALVYDGTNGILNGYHNGSLVATKTNVTGKVEAIGNYGAIGKHWWANAAGHSTRLNFVVDEVKVHRCALDSSDVMDEYTRYINSIGILQATKSKTLKVYPNPFSSSCTFEFSNPDKQKLDVTIYNCLGQSVQEYHNITSKRLTIEKGMLKKGVYFYQIQNKLSVIDTGKLIVE